MGTGLHVSKEKTQLQGAAAGGPRDGIPETARECDEVSPIPVDIAVSLNLTRVHFAVRVTFGDITQTFSNGLLQILLSESSHVSVESFGQQGIASEQ